jgi:hypothetical protein
MIVHKHLKFLLLKLAKTCILITVVGYFKCNHGARAVASLRAFMQVCMQAQQEEVAMDRPSAFMTSPDRQVPANPTSPRSQHTAHNQCTPEATLDSDGEAGAAISTTESATRRKLPAQALNSDQNQAQSRHVFRSTSMSLGVKSRSPTAQTHEGTESPLGLVEGAESQGMQEGAAGKLFVLKSNGAVELLEGGRSGDLEGSHSKNVSDDMGAGEDNLSCF